MMEEELEVHLLKLLHILLLQQGAMRRRERERERERERLITNNQVFLLTSRENDCVLSLTAAD